MMERPLAETGVKYEESWCFLTVTAVCLTYTNLLVSRDFWTLLLLA